MKVNRYKAWRLAGAAVLRCGCVARWLCPRSRSPRNGVGRHFGHPVPDMAEFIPMLVAFIVLVDRAREVRLGPSSTAMLDKRREDTIKDALEKSGAATASKASASLAGVQEAARGCEERRLPRSSPRPRRTGEAVKADITAKAQAEAADDDREGPRGHRGREEGRHRRAAGLCRRPVRCRGLPHHRRGPVRRRASRASSSVT